MVESGIGAAAIPELMVKKELELATLHSIQVIDSSEDANGSFKIIQPVWKLKHRQRFQTRLSIAFEQILFQ